MALCYESTSDALDIANDGLLLFFLLRVVWRSRRKIGPGWNDGMDGHLDVRLTACRFSVRIPIQAGAFLTRSISRHSHEIDVKFVTMRIPNSTRHASTNQR